MENSGKGGEEGKADLEEGDEEIGYRCCEEVEGVRYWGGEIGCKGDDIGYGGGEVVYTSCD